MSETLNWKEHLRDTPVFGILEPEDIDELLRPELSGEQRFNDGDVILREGESGASLYVIGRGNVRVDAHAPDGSAITLARLAEGDVFGEMGFFDRKPRSASVVVDDENDCIVRRIEGDPFHDFLLAHPRLEFKLTLILSDRLRRVTEGAISMQFRALAEKFELLNAKNEAQLDTINNALKTTTALFDATDNRVKEISERAESVVGSVRQNQERFSTAIKIGAFIVTIAGIVLGYLGFDKFQDIQETYAEIQGIQNEVGKYREGIIAAQEEIESVRIDVYTQKRFEPKYYEYVVLEAIFFKEIGDGRVEGAAESLYLIMALDRDEISEILLKRLILEIINDNHKREQIKQVLNRSIPRIKYKYKFLLYYLLLASFDMDGQSEKYDSTIKELVSEVDKFKLRSDERIKDNYSEILGPENFEDALYARLYGNMLASGNRTGDENLDDIERDARKAAVDEIKKIRAVWKLLP